MAEVAWLAQIRGDGARIVVVELGAGTAIRSVRHFSHRISRDYGARIIRINPREPQVPNPMDVGIAAGSLEALTRIDALLEQAIATSP